jgi:hypothetical protein
MATAAATLFFLVGLAAITVGTWLYSPPAGLIVGGTFAVLGAWYVRKGMDGSPRASD